MANYFINSTKNFGDIRQRVPVKALFMLKTGAPNILSIKESCSKCLKIRIDNSARMLGVTYTPTKVPRQRLAQGFYETKKSITVTFITGEKQILYLTATVLK